MSTLSTDRCACVSTDANECARLRARRTISEWEDDEWADDNDCECACHAEARAQALDEEDAHL